MKRTILLLLISCALLVAPLGTAQSGPSREAVGRLIEEVQEIQQVYIASNDLLTRMIHAELNVAYADWSGNQLSAALEQARQTLEASRKEAPELLRRSQALAITPLGDTQKDEALAAGMDTVRTGPKVILQLNDIMAEKIALAEAGNRAGYDALDRDWGSVLLVQHDLEIAMMGLNVAMQKDSHPQHGLSRAWLASLEGMRPLIAITTLPQEEVVPALEALPGQLAQGAEEMRSAVADSRRATARLAKGNSIQQVLAALGAGDGVSPDDVRRLAKEYDDALDIELELANVLESNSKLFQRVAQGDDSDEVFDGIDANDARYERLIGEREREMQERLAVAKSLVE